MRRLWVSAAVLVVAVVVVVTVVAANNRHKELVWASDLVQRASRYPDGIDLSPNDAERLLRVYCNPGGKDSYKDIVSCSFLLEVRSDVVLRPPEERLRGRTYRVTVTGPLLPPVSRQQWNLTVELHCLGEIEIL